ncbi:hypothetical protein DSECCO2_416040 [anaerobic digester metagenome]
MLPVNRNRLSILFAAVSILLLVYSCGSQSSGQVNNTLINSDGLTIQERFAVPDGFSRLDADSSTFAFFLRSLPLKPEGEKVRLFDGREKPPDNVYCAVIDLPIGTKNLHQCADAVIRLRAEYLWHQKKYSDIHFNFTNGFRADYSKWMSGKRIHVDGHNCSWVARSPVSNTHDDLWNYLETVFMYAGTLSLEKELVAADWDEMRPGDVLIQGGSPGHAVIVVDMILNETTGERRFLLAQSYMPAQEIQILINPDSPEISPWYSLECSNEIHTPEWNFKKSELKRF